MNDPLLMGVLDGFADFDKEMKSLLGAQAVLIAEPGQRHAPDQFHDEVGASRLRGAGIEHFGDVRMLHERQRLTLHLEPGDDLPGVHSQLDDLQGHATADRFVLFGDIDDAKAAFADLFEQFVGADAVADLLAGFQRKAGRRRGTLHAVEVTSGLIHRLQQSLDALYEPGIVGRGALKKSRPLSCVLDGEGFGEELLLPLEIFTHVRSVVISHSGAISG